MAEVESAGSPQQERQEVTGSSCQKDEDHVGTPERQTSIGKTPGGASSTVDPVSTGRSRLLEEDSENDDDNEEDLPDGESEGEGDGEARAEASDHRGRAVPEEEDDDDDDEETPAAKPRSLWKDFKDASNEGPRPPLPKGQRQSAGHYDRGSGSHGGGGHRVKGGKSQGKGHHGKGNVHQPPPPSLASLKALPPDLVERFLAFVQEANYPEALRGLRKVRRAVKGRGCSKEAFGGLRACLHHLLESCACSGRLDEALDILQEMKQGNESRLVSAAAFNAVLRGLLSRSSLHEARFVVREEMPRLGVTPSESTLNLLMDTAARAGPAHMEEAWDVLEEMQKRGLRADKYIVSILTKGISERQDGQRRTATAASRGVSLVEEFLRRQPEDVDEVLVNSLLDVFCRMNDMPRFEATLQKMREYGIRGSAVTYGTIVKAYGRSGCIDKVIQAWDEMTEMNLVANAVTYGCMLDACVKCGRLDKALDVFTTMKDKNLHRNTILYATLIKGFAKVKDPNAARSLQKEMLREGVACNVVVYNSLVDACVRANDLYGAAEVLSEMTNSGVQPDLITYSTLIKGYCGLGELGKAMQLTQVLQARNLECDEIVYNSLLEGCVKAGDLQLGAHLFEEMRAKGVKPSPVTFSILVKLFSRAGRLDLACQLVAHEMREIHGVQPTRMVWSCLITSAVKAKDMQRAAAALEVIDSERCAIGGARASMYASVIDGCLMTEEVDLALQLCHRAYKHPMAFEAPGALSMELLRRVFEAAGPRHYAEAQNVLVEISPMVGDQARTTLEGSLALARRIAASRGGAPRPNASGRLPSEKTRDSMGSHGGDRDRDRDRDRADRPSAISRLQAVEGRTTSSIASSAVYRGVCTTSAPMDVLTAHQASNPIPNNSQNNANSITIGGNLMGASNMGNQTWWKPNQWQTNPALSQNTSQACPAQELSGWANPAEGPGGVAAADAAVVVLADATLVVLVLGAAPAVAVVAVATVVAAADVVVVDVADVAVDVACSTRTSALEVSSSPGGGMPPATMPTWDGGYSWLGAAAPAPGQDFSQLWGQQMMAAGPCEAVLSQMTNNGNNSNKISRPGSMPSESQWGQNAEQGRFSEERSTSGRGWLAGDSSQGGQGVKPPGLGGK
eukprot:CAMPEP_0206484484 /NCGR_PEP_ID=MMETSP0324_2-20121206/40004_1 /ASSEMBLY_ACC=CAM_ASM_000836 /TAXON_ID=2866 /ORGANISM="Crypthecodinium cohnii, Strain Seligo" /LENGTH=1133 /DNA_ID=CAMNT_0053962645 /DNA_START=10 /DNA_END=3411 /DNA_ORIENTATION=+